MTQEAIDKLIRYLELGKDDLPSKDELERMNRAAATDEHTAAAEDGAVASEDGQSDE